MNNNNKYQWEIKDNTFTLKTTFLYCMSHVNEFINAIDFYVMLSKNISTENNNKTKLLQQLKIKLTEFQKLKFDEIKFNETMQNALMQDAMKEFSGEFIINVHIIYTYEEENEGIPKEFQKLPLSRCTNVNGISYDNKTLTIQLNTLVNNCEQQKLEEEQEEQEEKLGGKVNNISDIDKYKKKYIKYKEKYFKIKKKYNLQ
jgi:hypothetical protein